MEKKQNTGKLPLAYRCFKSYLRFLYEKVMYKDIQYLNTENIPSDGTPLLIVSNHQNALNDAIGILMSFRDRLVHFIVRADVFSMFPGANKFLRSIGLLPAFRINHEGEEAVKNNGATFRDSEQALADGQTVVIFPESGHQTGHFLGTFSYGYTKMAFEAGELTGFEKEIFILPSCNHYSRYHGIRRKSLVKFGIPISIKPFYELYKTKPRTAQRQVNELVRSQIESMMLDIKDIADYDAIEFLRQGDYGTEFAKENGFNPENLPEKLASDRILVTKLATATGRRETSVSFSSASTSWDGLGTDDQTQIAVAANQVEQDVPEIYSKALQLKKGMADAGVSERNFKEKATWGDIIVKIIGVIILLPLAVFALWPSVISYFVPMYFNKKMEDSMFEGTLLFAANALFIFPILAIVTIAVVWPLHGFLQAIVWIVLFPLLCIVEWTYCGWLRDIKEDINYRKSADSDAIINLTGSRVELYDELNKMLK